MKKSVTLSILVLSFCSQAQIFNTQKGTPADKNLERKRSGVIQYKMYTRENGKFQRRKKVPRLNIGSEDHIQLKGWAQKLPDLPTTPNPQLQIPALIEVVNSTQEDSKAKVQPVLKLPEMPKIAHKAIPKYRIPKFQFQRIKIPKLKTMLNWKKSQYSFLEALIFLEIHKNYELAFGLMAGLTQDPTVGEGAKFYQGVAAQLLGLENEAKTQFSNLMSKYPNSPYSLLAFQSLQKIISHNDPKIVDQMLKVKVPKKWDISSVHFAKSHVALGQKDFPLALKHSDKVLAQSDYFFEAQLIKAISLYNLKKYKKARYLLEIALKKANTSHLRSLASLTLARMMIQDQNYEQAQRWYKTITSDNPLWLESLIETGWTQLLAKDNAGAIGNMHSLHIDLFKNAVIPESFLVQTIGYLNLCQYGDALHSIHDMHRKYIPIIRSIESFQKGPMSKRLYKTTMSYLKETQRSRVHGLHSSAIVEIARHPLFIEWQKRIQRVQKEKSILLGISKNLLKSEKVTKIKIKELQNKVKQLEKQSNADEDTADELKSTRSQLARWAAEYNLSRKARRSVAPVRKRNTVALQTERNRLIQKSNQLLLTRLARLQKSLQKQLDESDVLKFEIFEGAGDHLRLQMAGRDMGRKNVALNDGQKKLSWDFKGEIWEDEIGNYRSNIKNVCATEEARR